MSKRKALSTEQKKIKLLELFQESNDVYQLKDLEKIAPKNKGIVLQSVKSILQELVDDGQVHVGKVGRITYYWSFPSETLRATRRRIEIQNSLNTELDLKIGNAKIELGKVENPRENFEEIQNLENEIEILKKKKMDLEQKLAIAKNNLNSQNIALKEAEIKNTIQAANRWTDNIFAIQSFCRDKYYIQAADLNKNFGIPDDLDYLNIN